VTAPLTPGGRRFQHGRYDNETPEQVAERLRVVADRRRRDIEHQRQKRAARTAQQAAAPAEATG
jgi:hypothetical protein